MSNAAALRINGYSADDNGIICRRSGDRWAHEWTGVVRIEVSKDSRASRALVDAVIAAVDEPRALVGRDRRGGAVMLFRVDNHVNPESYALALPSGEEIVITFGPIKQAVEVDSYQWQKSRSPYEVPRDFLALLHHDQAEAAHRAALSNGADTAENIERERAFDQRASKYKADLAAGLIKTPTADELQAAEDERLVAAYAGQEILETDGNWAAIIVRARRAVAGRKKAQAA